MFFFCLVLHLRSHDSQLTWFRTCPVVLSSTPFFLFFSPLRFKKRGGEAAYCTMYSTVSERKKSRIEKWCDECHRCGSYIVACCLVATLFFSFSFSLAFTALKWSEMELVGGEQGNERARKTFVLWLKRTSTVITVLFIFLFVTILLILHLGPMDNCTRKHLRLWIVLLFLSPALFWCLSQRRHHWVQWYTEVS